MQDRLAVAHAEGHAADDIGEHDDRRCAGERQETAVEGSEQADAENRARQRQRNGRDIVDQRRHQVRLLDDKVADQRREGDGDEGGDAGIEEADQAA